jgi:hypothetical protein
VRLAVEEVGAPLQFLPPCSPDFNPIELSFAKLKAIVRAARPHTFDAVCEVIAASLVRFLSDKCARYFRHCGFRKVNLRPPKAPVTSAVTATPADVRNSRRHTKRRCVISDDRTSGAFLMSIP